MDRTRSGRRVLLGLVAVLAVAVAAVVARALYGVARDHLASDTCTFGSYRTDTGQAAVAAEMIGAVTRYPGHLPVRAQALVLAAALQESKLRNLAPGAGDRDSVGVLQQRPSQGWGGGDPQKLTNVGEATTEFLRALQKVPHWQRMSAADAIQAVQVSADGSLYAQHADQARVMAAALSGRRPAAISCDFGAPTVVAAPRVIAAQASRQLGIDTPKAVGGRTVRVPGAGWQTAAWFVANADRLGINQVDYDHRTWTRADGWSDSAASARAVTATMATV